jgi:hypothetical protein
MFLIFGTGLSPKQRYPQIGGWGFPLPQSESFGEEMNFVFLSVMERRILGSEAPSLVTISTGIWEEWGYIQECF